MKIVSGLGSIEEYIPFVQAGADEFFAGYVPFGWAEKYGIIQPLNRREVLYYNVQIGAESELEILGKMIKTYGKPVHLTFNSLQYTEEQYPLVTEILAQCMKLGFRSFILADPGLMLYVREQGLDCQIHLSGETAEVNRGMLDVFRTLNLKRLIFHRKNTIKDMESVIAHEWELEQMEGVGTQFEMPDQNRGTAMEFEAFALNEMCHYSGAFCNSLHCDELTHLCKVPYWMGKIREEDHGFDRIFERIKAQEEQEEEFQTEEAAETMESASIGGTAKTEKTTETEEIVRDEDGYLTGETGCGLCAFYRFREAGITHLKLVGRGNYTEFMRKDIAQVRRALEILEQSGSEKEYQAEIKKALWKGSCSGNCYYREVF